MKRVVTHLILCQESNFLFDNMFYMLHILFHITIVGLAIPITHVANMSIFLNVFRIFPPFLKLKIRRKKEEKSMKMEWDEKERK